MASISSKGAKNHHTYRLTLTEKSTSTEENESSVDYSFDLIDDANWFWETWGNSITYSISANGSVIKSGSIPNHTTKNQNIASGSFTVPHNADGTKSISYSFSVTDGANQYYTSGNASASGSMTLTTIPRATTPTFSATSVTMGGSITITMTPASSGFKHKLRYAFGSLGEQTSGLSIGANFTAAGTSTATFTPPTSLANQIPSANSGVCTIYCYTYNSSGTQIGSTVSKTITLNVPSYTLTGSVALTGNNLLSGAYVQGKSTVRAVITAGTSYGATIKSYSSQIDGKTYSGQTFTTSVLSNGSKSVSVTIMDSRNKTHTFSSSAITVYPYSVPYISIFNVERQSDGTTVIASLAGGIAAVNNKNTKTFKITLNGVTNTLTSSAYTINGSTTFTNVPTDSTLTATATITDSYTSATKTATLPTVAVTMDFYKDGNGIAMGKVAEYGDLLDVNWPLRARKIATIDGLVTFKNHLYHHGHIYMGGNKTAANEHHIKFSNPDASTYPHNVYIYGGNPSSNVAVGLYDAGKSRQVAAYNDVDNAISIGNGSARINFNGNRMNDFVVEQGTSGGWSYRKWNNGVSECWKIVSMATGTFSGTSPAFYCTPGTKYNYPSIFTAITDVQMTVALNGGGVVTAFNCSGIDTTYCEPGFIRLYGGSASLNVSVSIHVMGKWN